MISSPHLSGVTLASLVEKVTEMLAATAMASVTDTTEVSLSRAWGMVTAARAATAPQDILRLVMA